MKARPVDGLDCDGPFRENAARMAEVRIDELWELARAAQDPREVKASHDARIAAKRVRYLLELSEVCFGAPAKEGAKTARDLQDLLGEIHDYDELAPRARAHAERLRAEGRAADGLDELATAMEDRRGVLHREFVRRWREMEQNDFRARLEEGLAPR